MEEKKIEPIQENKISNIVEFGKDGNKLIVETVGTFRNLMNFLHKPTTKKRIIEETYTDNSGKQQKREIVEIQNIYYLFEETKEFELIQAQTVKIILEEKEVDLTANNLLKFFDREPYTFKKIMDTIEKSYVDMGFLGK
ncbi:hypothetical protein [Fusobacterium gastrosuis]|uniref:hypothetical protein n=1 Tax=Fusobacterium gastrosuis TaxID=1755100 RepID=UPI0029779540|nr:hypothetical protein [Fusobacteriaceae bacterium]MDY5306404.1 hypothetical protein [Fusobacterium gastrosuis]MDY5713822.1 hypothetical protein [Fusobacterium gastrosuis]MDY5795455.1 hypothetical protein [Fusobacterium gastrosuis]